MYTIKRCFMQFASYTRSLALLHVSDAILTSLKCLTCDGNNV